MTLNARALLSTMFLTLLTACGDAQGPLEQPQSERAEFIVATNTPLQYFTQRLLGNEIEVLMLAPENTDPAQWQPSVDEILQLQQARLILLNGAGYSNWLNKVSVSDNSLVNTSSTVREQWIELGNQASHSHGPKGEHAHSGYAFTIWMDMKLAQDQAKQIALALQDQWPEKAENVRANLASLLTDLATIDEGFMSAAGALKSRQLIYSHPVYQYFERRYGLAGVSLHWEPNLMPNEEQWREIQRLNTEDTLFIWEAEPTAVISDRMKKANIEFVVLDPAANQREKDWMTVQRENLVRLSSK